MRLHRDTAGERDHLAPQSSHAADNPSIVWVQRERGLRLTRVRGVPLAAEGLGFRNLGGVHQACTSVAIRVRSAIQSSPIHLTSPFGARMVTA